MVTTFQSRELVRDELVALFVANGSWNNVYGYFPSASELVGKTPLLIILSDGTRQQMSSLDTNPTSYQFLCITFVLADSETDNNVTPALASDKIDELDKTFRQVIRNNAGALTNANNMRFADGFSVRRDVNAGGKPYITEEYTIITELSRGAI